MKNNSFYKLITVVLFVLVVLVSMFTLNMLVGDKRVDIGKNISEKNPVVVLETNLGTINIEIYMDKMPITAGNFKKLVEEGYYDGIRFHRVISGFMLQAGDPLTKNESMIDSWGTGGPGYTIEDEFVEGLSNVRGTISMANTGRPNSGGSQFFINTADNIGLDFDKEPKTSRHPVFGRVIGGMDVVDKIEKVETTGSPYNRPIDDVIIERAYIE